MLNGETSQNKSILKWLTWLSLLGLMLVLVMPFIGNVGVANGATAGAGGLWVRFLGQFHPMLLHLPIGVVCWVVVAELIRLLTKGRFQFNSLIPLAFGATAAVIASVLGYFLYLTGEYPVGELLEEHKRDGILFTVLLILTLLTQVRSKLSSVKVWARGYVVCLVLTFLTMLSAGHHGGELTHGEPSNAWPAKVLREREARAAKVDLLVYEEMVKPILEEKCVSCHGPKKAKSGLRVDSVAFMLEGGEETDCLIPGNVKDSTLISYLHLPLDDDLRMPPEDKKQLSEEEIKILEWWVVNGAPENKRQSEMSVRLE